MAPASGRVEHAGAHLHRTRLHEHFRVEGRRTWFETIEEMQRVLDDYLMVYNHHRPHKRSGMCNATPI